MLDGVKTFYHWYFNTGLITILLFLNKTVSKIFNLRVSCSFYLKLMNVKSCRKTQTHQFLSYVSFVAVEIWDPSQLFHFSLEMEFVCSGSPKFPCKKFYCTHFCKFCYVKTLKVYFTVASYRLLSLCPNFG